MMALLEANLLSADVVRALFSGSLAKLGRSIRSVQETLQIAACNEIALGQDPPAHRVLLPTPPRVLRQSRCGAIPAWERFRSEFEAGQRAAKARAASALSPSFSGGVASFDADCLERLLPGVRLPRNLKRDRYLGKLSFDAGKREAWLDLYSATGLPLVRHRLPPATAEWIKKENGHPLRPE